MDRAYPFVPTALFRPTTFSGLAFFPHTVAKSMIHRGKPESFPSPSNLGMNHSFRFNLVEDNVYVVSHHTDGWILWWRMSLK